MTNILGKKFEGADIKKLCEKATEAADDVDIILGGMGWLINSPEAKNIISFFDPEIRENLDVIRATSRAPLRISEQLIVTVDKYIVGPKCKRASRSRKKEEGIEMMSSLFENITNNEAYNKVCDVATKTVSLLSKLITIIGKILNSTTLVAGISAAAGPEVIVGLKYAYTNGKTTLEFTKTVQKTICVFLRKEIKK